VRKRGETKGERIGLVIGGRPGDKWGGEYRIVSRGAPAFEDLQPYEPAASGGSEEAWRGEGEEGTRAERRAEERYMSCRLARGS
jgi:hypothetical protein